MLVNKDWNCYKMITSNTGKYIPYQCSGLL